MNARLAARLTGWKIDIQSDTEFAQAEAEAAFGGGGEEEEFTGRCAAILANGKRCPNAALPGSRYCGVPAHQELATRDAETPDEEPIVTEPEPGAVSVSSGVAVSDLSQARGVQMPELIKILMGLGQMRTGTQSFTDDEVELIAEELKREIEIKHVGEEEEAPEAFDDPE